jgi:hypothetical protein
VVVDGGARLRLDNGTSRPVTVQPAGDGRRPVVPPGGSLAWADAWLGDPTAPAGGGAWTVPLSVGDLAVTVRGDRVWPPVPHPFPWWALTVAALLAAYSVGGAAAERRTGGPTTALAGIVLAVTAAHAVHVVGESLRVVEPPGPVALLGAAGIGVVCWLLGPAAAVLTLRGHLLGPALYGPVGFLTALLTVADTDAFHRAVVTFGGPFDLDRLAVTVAVGGGVGLFLAAVVAMRRTGPPVDDAVELAHPAPTASA